MELKDFTEKEQEMIKKGLTTSKISDKETSEKILALVPQDLIKRIPFFVRKHATTRTIKRISIEHPDSTLQLKQVVKYQKRTRRITSDYHDYL